MFACHGTSPQPAPRSLCWAELRGRYWRQAMPHSPCDLPVLCVRCERGMCGRVRVRRVCQRLWRRQWTGAVVFAFLISSLQEAVHKVRQGHP